MFFWNTPGLKRKTGSLIEVNPVDLHTPFVEDLPAEPSHGNRSRGLFKGKLPYVDKNSPTRSAAHHPLAVSGNMGRITSERSDKPEVPYPLSGRAVLQVCQDALLRPAEAF